MQGYIFLNEPLLNYSREVMFEKILIHERYEPIQIKVLRLHTSQTIFDWYLEEFRKIFWSNSRIFLKAFLGILNNFLGFFLGFKKLVSKLYQKRYKYSLQILSVHHNCYFRWNLHDFKRSLLNKQKNDFIG